MKRKKSSPVDISKLTVNQLESQLTKEEYRARYLLLLKNTIYTIIIIVALGIILATLVMPVFEVKGNSMTPTYEEGNIVVSLNTKKFKQQDILAFYYENKILIRRVVATEGQWVNVKDGIVYVDGEKINTPYEDDPLFDYGDIEYPYQVPSEQLFVLSDNRKDTQDSRYAQIGCIEKEHIIGKVLFRIWK